MNDYSDPFESPQKPPTETWWERELLRNQKLMDKYMEVLGDHPDWDKWKSPEDLYSKSQFDLDPALDDDENFESYLERIYGASLDPDPDEPDQEPPPPTSSDLDVAEPDSDMYAFENDPPDSEDYPGIAKQSREFALRIFELKDLPAEVEVLYLSAGKIGANIAGGHGLGYDEDSICGNIVKCRWALADCEFCREMLEHLHQRTGQPEFAEILQECRTLATALQYRVERLRSRVWW